MNIQEDYVSFETAKLLKEKGFKGFTMFSYSTRGSTMCGHWENEIDWMPKCTLQMAMKWLREVHNIDICAFPEHYNYILWGYNCRIYKNKEQLYSSKNFKFYEQAVETTIKYCLESLI